MSTDWRTACEDVVRQIVFASQFNAPAEDEILASIDKFAYWVKKGWEPAPSTFEIIGVNAFLVLCAEERGVFDDPDINVGYITDILCKKQHDYGPGNISKFGTIGIMVRMSDKAERLRNLRARGTSPQNESLVDTLFDILGYSIVALMWMEGTFLLDLIVEEPKIIHDPSPAQLEEFFAAPPVHGGEMHFKDCGIAGGWPHPASAHDSDPNGSPGPARQQKLPTEMQWKPRR